MTLISFCLAMLDNTFLLQYEKSDYSRNISLGSDFKENALNIFPSSVFDAGVGRHLLSSEGSSRSIWFARFF